MPKRYREFALPLLLLAVAGVLVGVLVLEWLHYRTAETEMKNRLAQKVEVRLPATDGGQERYELPGLDQYNATVERPLFMENRKPAEVDTSEPEAPPAPRAPLNIKLMGVSLTSEQAVGLFVDARGKYKRLHKGEQMSESGWTVVDIFADKTVMEQDGTREELKLIKPKVKRPQGPPAQPGMPPPQPGQFPGQPMPPPDPNNPELPQDPAAADPNNPNETVDETVPIPPEDFPPDPPPQ
ncbi:MAG: type II secretion system protein N [Candidatus Methylumidiphilus sp.]